MKLYWFLRYQRYLGLTDLDYCSSQRCYILKPSWSCYLVRFIVQGAFLAIIVSISYESFIDYEESDSRIDVTMDFLVITAACSTQLIINFWLNLQQQSQLMLLKRLTRVARELNVGCLETLFTRWLYRLWIINCIYNVFDVVFDTLFYRDFGAFQLCIILRDVCGNFTVTCYCALLQAIKQLLRAQTAQLKNHLQISPLSLHEVSKSLNINDKLYSICQNDMVSIFGAVFVFSYLYTILDSADVCFQTLPKDEFSYLDILFLIKWMMPLGIYLSMPLMINDLAEETIRASFPFKMKAGKLLTCIHYQRYLGLNDVDYSHIQKRYILNASWSSYGIQLLMLIILFAALLAAMTEVGVASVDLKSRSADRFHYVLILSMPITQILVNGWLRYQQASQQHLLQMMAEIASRLEVDTLKLPRPRWLYRLWVGVCIIYAINITVFVWTSLLSNPNYLFLISFLCYFILIVRSNFIITCYNSLVHVSLVLLQAQQDQLDSMLKSISISAEEVSQSLCLFDELLLLCQQEIVQVFGGALVFIMIFSTLNATCALYISAIETHAFLREFLRIVIWYTPLYLYICLPMTGNKIADQLFVLGIMFISLCEIVTENCGFNIDMESKQGKSYYFLVLWIVPVTQLMINTWFHIHQQSQSILLQKLNQFAFSLKVDTMTMSRPRRLYRIWVSSSIFYALYLSAGLLYYLTYCPRHSFYIICLLLSLMRTNFIMTCYASLVSIVMSLLQAQANHLEQAISSPSLSLENLAENLQTHDELQLLCLEELLETYGVAMLLNFLYLALYSIYFFYLSALEKLFSPILTITILIWKSLICLYMTLPLEDKRLVKEKMLPFLHYQRFLGLTDLFFSKSLQRYVVHATWCTIIIRLLVLSVFICEITELLIKVNVNLMGLRSRSGEMFFHLVYVVAPTTELLVNLWLCVTLKTQEMLLNRLSELSRLLQLDTMTLGWPRWLIRFWLGISLLYICTISHYTIGTWNSYQQFLHLFTMVGYFMHLVRTNYIITCYTSLVYVVQRLLRAQAEQLKSMQRNPLTSPEELGDCLSIHNHLLLLCQEEMNQVFGVVMIFSYFYMLLDATSILYIAALEDRFSFNEVMLVLMWMTPYCLFMIMPLAINVVAKQNAWLIWLQGSNVRIVRQLELYRRKYLTGVELTFPKYLLSILVIMNLIYLVNFVLTSILEWLSNASIWFKISTFGFPLRAIISSFILGTYMCLIHVVRHVLRWNQCQLETLVRQLQQSKRNCSDLLRLRCCLDLHDRLLVLCSDQISMVYGFNICLCVLFSSLDATSIIYILTVSKTDTTPFQDIIMTFIWLSPTLMTSMTALISNSVRLQIILFAALFIEIKNPGEAYVDLKSRSGNLFHHMLVLSIPITQILVNGWLRYQQASQQHLLQMLAEIATRLEVDTLKLPRPRWLYFLWVDSCIFYFIIMAAMIWGNLYWKHSHLFILSFMCYFILIVRSNFIIVCYTSLVHVSLVLLQAQQDQLDSMLKSISISAEEVSQSLCLFDELLLLCQHEIVQVFGGALVFVIIYNIFDATCILYMAAFETKSIEMVRTFIWIIPLFSFLFMPIIVNNLAEQLLVLLILCFSLYEIITNTCVYNLEMESKSGDNFYLLGLLATPIIQFLINIWLRIQQQPQRILLQKLSQLAISLKKMLAILLYQRFLGLTDLDFSKSLQRYVKRATWCTFVTHLLALTLIACKLIELFFTMKVDYAGVESRIPQLFIHFINVISAMSELIVNLWLRLTLETQKILLNRLKELSERLQLDTLALGCPRWLFRLWMGIGILQLCLISYYTITTWNSYQQSRHLFGLIGNLLHLVRTNYIITCYTSLVYIVRRLLRAQADQLKNNSLTSAEELRDCISIHDQLLLLCQEEMIQVFGVAMIFSYLSILLDATCIVYIAALQERFSYKNVILELTWASSICVYMIMPLIINEIAKQLNSALGLVMVLITALVLLSTPTAFFFLITIVFAMDPSRVGLYFLIRMLILTLLWGLLWMVAMLTILQKDMVRQEVLFVFSLCNYANGIAVSGLSTIHMLLYVIVYSYGFLAMCLLLVFFVCLQRIVAAGLAHYNLKLQECDSRTNFRRILYKRQRLLGLITGELNNCFGLLMLPVVPLILFMAPTGLLFLISTVMEGTLVEVSHYAILSFTCSLWNIPWLSMMTLLMRSDVITVEANKTAKILAKIPRTGSGLDKMVEKFLLKNLRQQPILTAYGFFALDKSTLFKVSRCI
ncbi:hypothetical protein ACLKA6_011944 [Drosophila palustris]